jgi:hypothetical protein
MYCRGGEAGGQFPAFSETRAIRTYLLLQRFGPETVRESQTNLSVPNHATNTPTPASLTTLDEASTPDPWALDKELIIERRWHA